MAQRARQMAKLAVAAERARLLAMTLTNPADAAILREYAEEVEQRVERMEVQQAPPSRLFWPQPGFAEVHLPMLRRTLKQVFPAQGSAKFDALLSALDEHTRETT